MHRTDKKELYLQLDDDREYIREMAYIQAEREWEEWESWQEVQKPKQEAIIKVEIQNTPICETKNLLKTSI